MAVDVVKHSQGEVTLAPTFDLLRGAATSTSRARPLRRARLVRRALLVADALGLLAAFIVAQLIFGDGGIATLSPSLGDLVFVASLPAWLLVARLHKLYDGDERTDHSTADETMRIFQFITIGSWLFFLAAWLHGPSADLERFVAFWGLAVAFVPVARVSARAALRRNPAYEQNAIIVGAGDVGQLLARKLVQHSEYGVKLRGFVDAERKELRADLRELEVLGRPERLPQIVRELGIERVIIAQSHADAPVLDVIRSLDGLDVRVDIVPPLYEMIGPAAMLDSVEGMPLVAVRTQQISRTTLAVKRAFDFAVAAVVLLVTAPLFAYIAIRIKRDSPGPVFFRQTRLGMNMREFTLLKFRTMHVDVDTESHRRYIESLMDKHALPEGNGLFKLERANEITNFGRWLRRTSLDELPQLINVLKGDMSLVGPRPCLPYEVEHFDEHHFERFRVPQGITGLWQVTARAHSTFVEALEMDAAYARAFSLGLDFRLLFRTPVQLVGHRGTR